MVQFENSGEFWPESDPPSLQNLPGKRKAEEPTVEDRGCPQKLSKISDRLKQKRSNVNYNPLDEPSPLGLQLKKSPSFLDLIQMRLSQANTAALTTANDENLGNGKKDLKCAGGGGTTDKLKASNFPATLLRIGSWECVSRYEGDLVAKCYFAKHKLVWEVLDTGLKSKIEIQWSDITAVKAVCPGDGPGSLDIVLGRQPLFFRETNPQPRKHTIWQPTADFTGGQASIYRRHLLQCSEGVLNKHFEKLIQCDPRLNLLSQQPAIVLDNPYFESKSFVFEDIDEAKCCGFDQLKSDFAPTISGVCDAASSCAAQSPSTGEIIAPVSRLATSLSPGTTPSKDMDNCAVEEITSGESGKQEQSYQAEVKVPAIHSSMSISDLLSHIEHCISGQMTSGEKSGSNQILEELSQHLLSDSNFSSASDEKFLMSRVNSLCCLLQKDSSTTLEENEDAPRVEGAFKNWSCTIPELSTSKDKVVGSSVEVQCSQNGLNDGLKDWSFSIPKSSTIKDKEVDSSTELEFSENELKQAQPTLPRNDSVTDLLLHLPRITSLPKFLFNIAEDIDNQAR